MTTAHAPGKIILTGEHAVVYGRPAIAVPVTQVQATATVEDTLPGTGCVLVAVDLNRDLRLADAPSDDPLATITRKTLAHLNLSAPDVTITISSTIPIASGMGSGAAVSTAIARALLKHLGHAADDKLVSSLVYGVEKLYHGTPSGIDNTVIAHSRPVFFVKDRLTDTFTVRSPLHILVADTGIASPTKNVVADVQAAWKADPERYNALFRSIGQITVMARAAIEDNEPAALGALLDGNQWLLQEIGVSSNEIEQLTRAARQAGALGAKLSGAGRGGNVIALVTEETRDAVAEAMRQAGARRVIATVVN